MYACSTMWYKKDYLFAFIFDSIHHQIWRKQRQKRRAHLVPFLERNHVWTRSPTKVRRKPDRRNNKRRVTSKRAQKCYQSSKENKTPAMDCYFYIIPPINSAKCTSWILMGECDVPKMGKSHNRRDGNGEIGRVYLVFKAGAPVTAHSGHGLGRSRQGSCEGGLFSR